MASRISTLLFTLFLLVPGVVLAANPVKEEPVSRPAVFRIGDLMPIYVSATSDVVSMPVGQLIETYRDLLEHVTDPELASIITARIADLESIQQEQFQAKAEKEGGEFLPDYTSAIAAYQKALADFPDRKSNDQLYYQLAKSYDLGGKGDLSLEALTALVTKFPETEYLVEAQFRRGDLLFSKGMFKEAQDAYQTVLDKGRETPFFENAVYMHGWSLFKRSFYEPSVESFTVVLDRTMPKDGRIEGVEPNRMALVEDSLRIMGIIFSYLDGPVTIGQVYSELGERSYEGLLYERLGDLYVSQQRYQDAIDTFRAYIVRNPMGSRAPELHNRILQTMQVAKFYGQAFEEKENFIRVYSRDGDYYAQADARTQEYISEYLYVYLDEVARFYHARAQKTRARLAGFKSPPDSDRQSMLKDYELARDFYARFVQTFPDNMHVPEKIFMMAEALSETGNYREAIEAYEKVAYQYGITTYSEDAAYASVVAYSLMIKNEKDENRRPELLKQKLAAQMAFVDNYGFSKYSKPILFDSIDMLYQEKDYEQVVAQSLRFLEMAGERTRDENLAIALVMGHSLFELKKYPEAEKSYQEALALMEVTDKRYAELVDRIAATIYRQAEALVAENRKMEAIEEFLRVGKVAPLSQYRKNADYDAAAYLLQEKQWQRAIDLLNDYRERFDKNKDSLDISSKLLAAYEGLERFDLAAAELVRVTALTKDPEKKREAMFLTAEYYEKAGDEAKALAMFKDYATRYPEPFDLAVETRYRIAEMYKKKNDDASYRFWLEAIIKADSTAGSRRTDRSRYLAALARTYFANDYRIAYENIKLTLPLKKSLTKKKEALTAALNRYEQILEYGVQEFSTQATYYVGEIYAQLSKDLMESQRPPGLNELELEQYSLLLEEQAYPFEEKAIELHESNVRNSQNGIFDKWVSRSISSLAKLLPGRYDKKEQKMGYSDAIY